MILDWLVVLGRRVFDKVWNFINLNKVIFVEELLENIDILKIIRIIVINK